MAESIQGKGATDFHNLLEEVRDALVIMNEEHRILVVNTQTEELFHYSHDELVGQSIETLLPARFRKNNIVASAGYFLGSRLELYGLRKDGTEFPIDVSLNPLKTHKGVVVLSAIRDITERRRVEEALRSSEERSIDLLDSARDLIHRATPEGRFHFVPPTKRLAQTLNLTDENRYWRQQLVSRHHFRPMVGQSLEMRHVFNMIQKVALRHSAVLLLGESGTGKELAARSIHDMSPRRDRPFVPVDCGALTPTLIESELFGHLRGAFTGALQTKEGLFESANDGSLFLDEIGELPMDLQSRLLRAIQEKEFRPVGATKPIPFQARLIAATNRNLEAEVARGAFRKDLYFRLNVVSITLPPLRERKMDIPALCYQILEQLSESEAGSNAEIPWGLSLEVQDRLLTHDWPGNVRELENCLERAVTMSSGPMIQMKDLPPSLQSPARPASTTPDTAIPLDEIERRAIERALTSTGGDKLMAARLLGIGKTTLYRKLISYENMKLRTGNRE